MKRALVFAALLVFCIFSLDAQDTKNKSGKLGISYNFILLQEDWRQNNLRYSGGSYGDEYYIEKMVYAIGISYVKPLNSWLEYETGIEYSRKIGSLKTVFPFDDFIESKANSTLISFPVTLNANFLRFFFVNSGVLIDLDAGGYKEARYQSGLGCVFGVAAKYDFKSGSSVFVNLYVKRRALIQFSPHEDRNQFDELGIRVGMSFPLSKKS